MGLSGHIFWLLPLAGLFYIAMIINLIRQQRLSETHALMWLATFVVLVLSPFFVRFLDRVALWLGIYYSPTLYLLVAILFLLANVLRNTMDISRLTDQNRRLTQEISILRHEVETGVRPPPPERSSPGTTPE